MEEAQFKKLFVTLWFRFLKHLLSFSQEMKHLKGDVEDNLKRALQFVVMQGKILSKALDEQVWAKSEQAIQVFYPNMDEFK